MANTAETSTEILTEISAEMSAETSTLLHPTDFSADGALAFAHAVRLSLRGRQTLSLLNIATSDMGPRRDGLRLVADLLSSWGLLPEKSAPEAIKTNLGFEVVSVGIPHEDPRTAILDYIEHHPCDFAVFATRDHRGLARWMERSAATRTLRKAKSLLLMVREGARGFVDPKTGEVTLKRVLMPVDGKLDPSLALQRLEAWLKNIGVAPEIRLIYVGNNPPKISPGPNGEFYPLNAREGVAAPSILNFARSWSADLIAMPTARRNGYLAALTGSVTSEILDDARWPVLSIPAS